jgi:hypothetical protein
MLLRNGTKLRELRRRQGDGGVVVLGPPFAAAWGARADGCVEGVAPGVGGKEAFAGWLEG